MMSKTASRAFTKGAVALFCIGFLVVITTFSAYAVSSSVISKQKTAYTSSVTPPSNCYVTLYTLSKTKAATSKCLVPGKMVNGRMVAVPSSGMHPNTWTTSCTFAHFEIQSNINGIICFAGSGYLAITIYKVAWISSNLAFTSSGWVRYYNPVGYYFYWQWYTTYFCPPGCGTSTITQVSID